MYSGLGLSEKRGCCGPLLAFGKRLRKNRGDNTVHASDFREVCRELNINLFFYLNQIK